MWNLGCLAPELLVSGHALIGLPSLFMGNGPKTINYEHHIKLSLITVSVVRRIGFPVLEILGLRILSWMKHA